MAGIPSSEMLKQMLQSLSLQHEASGDAVQESQTKRAEVASNGIAVMGYKPGDVVAAADPFSHVLKSNLKGQRCDNCYKDG